MKFLTSAAAVAMAGITALSLTACGGSKSGGDSDRIAIGIKFDQPGLGQKDGNTYKGFDVEVAKYVAKQLGYAEDKIDFRESPSPQRENMIQGGQVKLIFATYSMTDARKKKVSFGGPYFVAHQDLLVRSDSDVTSSDKLNGKKLCSVTGSTSAKKIKEKVPGVQLQEFDSYSKCVDAVVSGSIDAVTTDDVILAGYASQPNNKGKLKLVGQPFSDEKYGVGMKKGDNDLCKKVNDALKKMIDDGSWKKALETTVGESGYKIPEPPTSFDSCS